MNWFKMQAKTVIAVAQEIIRISELGIGSPRRLGSTSAFGGVGMYLSPLNFLGVQSIPCAGIVSKEVCLGHIDENYVLLVNERFLEVDKEVQEAIVAHELGHLVSGHLVGGVAGGRKRTLARLLGRANSLQRELEADTVAINEGHKKGLLRFLQEALWHAPQSKRFKDEILFRYHAAVKQVPAAKGVADNMLDAIYRRLR